jgi:hypothetical protein
MTVPLALLLLLGTGNAASRADTAAPPEAPPAAADDGVARPWWIGAREKVASRSPREVPGWEVWTLYEGRENVTYRSVLVNGNRVLGGPGAFRTARAALHTDDPVVLAQLSMKFAERNAAGTDPWVSLASGGSSRVAKALATPPMLTGDILVYWRIRGRVSDLMRITMNAATGLVLSTESGSRMLDVLETPRDPLARAARQLETGSGGTAISALRESKDPRAWLMIVYAAVNHADSLVQEAAVNALAALRPPGIGALLGIVIAGRGTPTGRFVALARLRELLDPGGRPAVERVAAGDPDQQMQKFSRYALQAYDAAERPPSRWWPW